MLHERVKSVESVGGQASVLFTSFQAKAGAFRFDRAYRRVNLELRSYAPGDAGPGSYTLKDQLR